MKHVFNRISRFTFRALSLFLAALSAFSPLFCTLCAKADAYIQSTSYTVQYDAVLDYLYSGSAPVFGSIGGEWRVLALARSGRVAQGSRFLSSYYASIERMVASNGSATLDSNKSTENSRLIIALTSIGRDARSVAGFDLTSPLSDFDYVKRQGINGVIFALIALDSNSAYGMSSLKRRCVDYLVEKEIAGGGWALAGSNADPDMTAMALTALSNYRSAGSSVRAAIDRGISKLSSMQNEDGGFSSYGTTCSESCSQVIVALSALGINADTDSRFVKSGGSVLSALLSFFTGNGFSHTPGGGVNGMASEQAAYSLCAFDRFRRGANGLFNMNDVTLSAPIDTPSPAPTQTPTPKPTQTPTPSPKPSPAPTQTPTPKPTQTAAPSGAPSQAPTVSPTQEVTGGHTDEPELSPESSETPEPSPEASETPEPSATPTAEPASSIEPDTAEPSELHELTFEPIDITGGEWNGSGERRSIKWVFPAVIGTILLASGGVLIFASRKKP